MDFQNLYYYYFLLVLLVTSKLIMSFNMQNEVISTIWLLRSPFYKQSIMKTISGYSQLSKDPGNKVLKLRHLHAIRITKLAKHTKISA